MSQRILSFGGSKNIGYYSAVRLLEKGATVYFLLRRPNAFDDDEAVKKYVASGQAVIVKGDATNQDDVRRAWERATADGVPVDACIFTIGSYPSFKLTKGLVLDVPNICTLSIINVLSAMPRNSPPKLILLSSVGMTKRGYSALPLLLKPLYSMLESAHADKVGMETAVAYAAGWPWTDEPHAGILPDGWKGRLPESGFEKRVLLVRAALLTDGKCKADKSGNAAYRASEEELGGYSISRRDVAHFIVEQALQDWEKYEGKVVNVGY